MKHKKQISDKKKFGLAAIACAMIGLIAATMAYFSSSHSFTNKFSAAKYSVETYDLIDSEKFLNMWPRQVIDASVKVKNTGDVPILARIRYPVKYSEDSLPDPFTIEEAERIAPADLRGFCYIEGKFASNKFLYNKSDGKFYYQGVITKDDGEIQHIKGFMIGESYNYISTYYLQSSDTSEPWNDDSKWKKENNNDKSIDKNLGTSRELGCWPRSYYRLGVYIETIQATNKTGNLLSATEVANLDVAGLKELWTNLGK